MGQESRSSRESSDEDLGARESSGDEQETRESSAEALEANARSTGADLHSKGLKKERKKVPPVKKASTGVCYLGRIPPHLKPLKLRHLLSRLGEVSRIYLAPEDHAARMRRKNAGGNSGKNFTEGWVEFVRKRDAKKAAAMLNGEPMDPRKRSAYHYDLWNIKYLHKFKWDNLTGALAYKTAVREQKLAAEISAAKKERDFYLSRVDQARAINSIQERKRKKESERLDLEPASTGVENIEDLSTKKPRRVRHFSQRKLVVDPSLETKPRLADDVLAAVFGK